jgi:Co/Zn/Cd efflux system component
LVDLVPVPLEALAVPAYKKDIARLAAASIVVAAAVTGIKYFAYLRTGSVALYSDALESIVNVVTAITALIAVRVAARPADRTRLAIIRLNTSPLVSKAR